MTVATGVLFRTGSTVWYVRSRRLNDNNNNRRFVFCSQRGLSTQLSTLNVGPNTTPKERHIIHSVRT
jgi:hypothetical protein